MTPTITQHFNNRVQISANLTPIEICLEKNERYVFLNLLDKRKEIKPNFQINDVTRTTELKKRFRNFIRLAGPIK